MYFVTKKIYICIENSWNLIIVMSAIFTVELNWIFLKNIKYVNHNMTVNIKTSSLASKNDSFYFKKLDYTKQKLN